MTRRVLRSGTMRNSSERNWPAGGPPHAACASALRTRSALPSTPPRCVWTVGPRPPDGETAPARVAVVAAGPTHSVGGPLTIAAVLSPPGTDPDGPVLDIPPEPSGRAVQCPANGCTPPARGRLTTTPRPGPPTEGVRECERECPCCGPHGGPTEKPQSKKGRVAERCVLGARPLSPSLRGGDLMHTERPTELKHITQWRKCKQLRLLQ